MHILISIGRLREILQGETKIYSILFNPILPSFCYRKFFVKQMPPNLKSQNNNHFLIFHSFYESGILEGPTGVVVAWNLSCSPDRWWLVLEQLVGADGNLSSYLIRASPCGLSIQSPLGFPTAWLPQGSRTVPWKLRVPKKYFNSQGESHSDIALNITLEIMQHYFHCFLLITDELQDHKNRGIQFHVFLRNWQSSIRTCRQEILLLLYLENTNPVFPMVSIQCWFHETYFVNLL